MPVIPILALSRCSTRLSEPVPFSSMNRFRGRSAPGDRFAAPGRRNDRASAPPETENADPVPSCSCTGNRSMQDAAHDNAGRIDGGDARALIRSLDRRAGKNARVPMIDIAMSGFFRNPRPSSMPGGRCSPWHQDHPLRGPCAQDAGRPASRHLPVAEPDVRTGGRGSGRMAASANATPWPARHRHAGKGRAAAIAPGIRPPPGWCRQAGSRAGGRREVAGTGRAPGLRRRLPAGLPTGRHDIAGPAECARTRRTARNPVFSSNATSAMDPGPSPACRPCPT